MISASSIKGTAVIVTCRNYGRYLAQCLESLFIQTVPFDDILVVDDGSTDATAEVCWRYASQGVRYERTDLGEQNAARNHGLLKTRHEFVVFVDADDWLAHNYHEKMRAALEKTQAGFAYCGAHVIRDGAAGEWFPGRMHPMRPFDFYDLWRANTILLPVMLRRSAWPSRLASLGFEGPDGKRFGEDWALWLSILHRGWNAIQVPERLSFYRFHSGNTSRTVVSNRPLEAAAKWGVRKQFLVYDLSVILLMSDDSRLNAEMLDSITQSELPGHTQIFTVYSSPGPHPSKWGRHWLHPLFCPLPEASPVRDTWLREALESARRCARGKEILVVIKIPLPANSLTRFLTEKLSTRADFFSARISSGHPSSVMAWRAVKGNPEKGAYSVPVIRRPRRVFAAALDLVLISAEAFHDPDLFSCAGQKTSYSPLELCLGAYAHKKGFRWFTGGSLRARRFQEITAPEKMKRLREFSDWPKVSLVIPVLNGEKTLPDLLRSLEYLDYPKELLEVLVVDNGSSDNTAAIAQSYQGVRFFREPRKGSYAARNRGIKESIHDFIAFVDSDCTVTPPWLKELTAAITADAACGAVAGDNFSIRPESRLSQIERAAGLFRNYRGSSRMPAYAITMNALYRRSVFKDVGMFDESVFSGADTEMCWRMQAQSSWKLLILNRKAWVTHKDPVSLVSLARRYWRIGGGHEALFNKYPGYVNSLYFWMPGSFPEVFLQSLKNLTVGFLFNKSKLSSLEIFLSAFRSLVLKASVIYHTRIREKKNASRVPSAIQIYLSREPLTPAGKRFCHLADKASEASPCIHADFVQDSRYNKIVLLSFLTGATTLWRWPHNLFSTGIWRIPGLSAEQNLRFHAGRILKSLRASKETPVELSGDLDFESLKSWQRALGIARTRLTPKNTFLGAAAVSFPAAGCVVTQSAGILDALFYRDLSLHSLWPIVIAGVFSPSEREALEALTWNASNLFILNTRTQEEARALGQAKLAINIFAWREHLPKSCDVFEAADKAARLPQIHIEPNAYRVEEGGRFLQFQNKEEAMRWILAWQKFPGWDWTLFWRGHQSPGSAPESEPLPQNPLSLDPSS